MIYDDGAEIDTASLMNLLTLYGYGLAQPAHREGESVIVIRHHDNRLFAAHAWTLYQWVNHLKRWDTL